MGRGREWGRKEPYVNMNLTKCMYTSCMVLSLPRAEEGTCISSELAVVKTLPMEYSGGCARADSSE